LPSRRGTKEYDAAGANRLNNLRDQPIKDILADDRRDRSGLEAHKFMTEPAKTYFVPLRPATFGGFSEACPGYLGAA